MTRNGLDPLRTYWTIIYLSDWSTADWWQRDTFWMAIVNGALFGQSTPLWNFIAWLTNPCGAQPKLPKTRLHGCWRFWKGIQRSAACTSRLADAADHPATSSVSDARGDATCVASALTLVEAAASPISENGPKQEVICSENLCVAPDSNLPMSFRVKLGLRGGDLGFWPWWKLSWHDRRRDFLAVQCGRWPVSWDESIAHECDVFWRHGNIAY